LLCTRSCRKPALPKNLSVCMLASLYLTGFSGHSPSCDCPVRPGSSGCFALLRAPFSCRYAESFRCFPSGACPPVHDLQGFLGIFPSCARPLVPNLPIRRVLRVFHHPNLTPILQVLLYRCTPTLTLILHILLRHCTSVFTYIGLRTPGSRCPYSRYVLSSLNADCMLRVQLHSVVFSRMFSYTL
jgi:hypothetical protein